MRFILLIAALLAPLLALAVPAAAQDKLNVVATFSVLGDLAAEVGGDRVEVKSLVGPDGDAHTYQPTPADARTLARAKVLVSNGLGLEGWIDRLAEAAGFKGMRIIASRGVPTLGDDPHCWQDVACARRYVANIADGLAAADPPNAAYYRERAGSYEARLDQLDSWVRGEIARVSPDKRMAITSHESFRYFTKAYGVQFHAPNGYKTDNQAPSARDLAAIIRQVRSEKIKALFIENMTNPLLVREIADEADAAVGPPLYSDALSKPGGPAATYEAMMRHNVEALVAGMQKN